MIGAPLPTVTVAVLVALPVALVAVSVYTVVTVGETLRVPVAVTVPMELMLTEVEFCTVHCKVEL